MKGITTVATEIEVLHLAIERVANYYSRYGIETDKLSLPVLQSLRLIDDVDVCDMWFGIWIQHTQLCSLVQARNTVNLACQTVRRHLAMEFDGIFANICKSLH